MIFRKWLPMAAIVFTVGVANPNPRLVVYIAIDQFPYHILERLNPYFTGDFAGCWIMDIYIQIRTMITHTR